MGRKRAKSRQKKINPTLWVFCEGETEAAYIAMLRSKYRIPIEIITKVAGSSINEKYIKRYKQGRFTHTNDKDFLIYDADEPGLMQKIKAIKNAVPIISNPCIELWFLLHYKNQTAFISGQNCIKQLENRNSSPYQKGNIDNRLEEKLKENQSKACERARKLTSYENPSSGMYLIIDELDKVNTIR
jgi:hypothetical protein